MADRNLLAMLMGRGSAGSPAAPLSFDELLRQERGNRDRAALRWNALQGGPVSTAYDPSQAALPAAAPVPAPRPDSTTTAAVPADAPAPTPLILPDLSRNPWETPSAAATTGLPDLARNPYDIMRDMAVRPEQGVVTSAAGGGEKGAVGKFGKYGSANRGAQGKVGKARRKPQQFRLG